MLYIGADKAKYSKTSWGLRPPKQVPNVSSSLGTPLYVVKNQSLFKKVMPVTAFSGSVFGSIGYLVGGLGLFYDSFKEKQTKNRIARPQQDGVKTITASTELGKKSINITKLGMTATAIAGIACGLGEGMPLMALGEVTNLTSASIVETPIGTGLFGIGIASIFASMALDNTPELKLNELQVMAEKSPIKKLGIYGNNMLLTAKEISSSIFQISKNIFNPQFFKENIFQLTPNTVVFREEINKNGEIVFSKMLRHNKNYLMHASSFTLGVGGVGIILSSLLNKKKAQKASLAVEEGGFLFDNIGITRYGLDKLTTGGKSAGISYAIGGVINAVSQFMGIDNKEGRAMQWLGISGVFLGYAIDRGKTLRHALKMSKFRPELTSVVREWKLDLSRLIKDKVELKKLLGELKSNTATTNKKFNKLEKSFKIAIGTKFKSTNKVQSVLKKKLESDILSQLKVKETADFDKTREILRVCSDKVFGSEPQRMPILAKNTNKS